MDADVALMKAIGLKAYRFSVNWGRVLPEGVGRVNEPGLDFYKKLVDELLKHDIEPLLTLYHWDLPVAPDDRGGWLHRDRADWFADYAATMFRALPGRVSQRVTLNDQTGIPDSGHITGPLAPARPHH